MNIGKKLQAARLAAGLLQKDVEKITGISYKKLSNYETGATKIDADTLRVLCKAYGVSSDQIIDVPVDYSEAVSIYERYSRLSEADRQLVDLILQRKSE